MGPRIIPVLEALDRVIEDGNTPYEDKVTAIDMAIDLLADLRDEITSEGVRAEVDASTSPLFSIGNIIPFPNLRKSIEQQGSEQ